MESGCFESFAEVAGASGIAAVCFEHFAVDFLHMSGLGVDKEFVDCGDGNAGDEFESDAHTYERQEVHGFFGAD